MEPPNSELRPFTDPPQMWVTFQQLSGIHPAWTANALHSMVDKHPEIRACMRWVNGRAVMDLIAFNRVVDTMTQRVA